MLVAVALAVAVGLGAVVAVGRGVGVERGWVGVAVGRGGGLKGAAEAAEAGSISPDTASARASSIAPASTTPPKRSSPNRKSDRGLQRLNRFILRPPFRDPSQIGYILIEHYQPGKHDGTIGQNEQANHSRNITEPAPAASRLEA